MRLLEIITATMAFFGCATAAALNKADNKTSTLPTSTAPSTPTTPSANASIPLATGSMSIHGNYRIWGKNFIPNKKELNAIIRNECNHGNFMMTWKFHDSRSKNPSHQLHHNNKDWDWACEGHVARHSGHCIRRAVYYAARSVNKTYFDTLLWDLATGPVRGWDMDAEADLGQVFQTDEYGNILTDDNGDILRRDVEAEGEDDESHESDGECEEELQNDCKPGQKWKRDGEPSAEDDCNDESDESDEADEKSQEKLTSVDIGVS